MPTICAFYGILVRMYWNDHAPPHFHALYAEEEVLIDIRPLDVLQGKFTPAGFRACAGMNAAAP
jgi:hypothetical protein